MEQSFAVTVAAKKKHLKAKVDPKTGKTLEDCKIMAIFTVVNTSDQTVKGRLKPYAIEPTGKNWLKIEGENERSFSPGESYNTSCNIIIPKGSSAGNYSMRLDASSVDEPDENFTEGEIFTIELEGAPDNKTMPWWIIILCASVVVVGVVVFFIVKGLSKVEVPVVIDLSYREAIDKINTLELNADVITGENIPADTGKWVIALQSPLAEVKIKKGDTVHIHIMQNIFVPDINGLKYFKARDILIESHLTFSVEEGSTPSDTGSWIVASQSPEAKTSVTQGSVVSVAIEPPQVVPEVIGQVYTSAKKLLENTGYKVNNVPSVQRSWIVYDVKPSEGTELPKKSNVILLVESGEVTVKTILGKTESEARRIIEATGLKPQKIGTIQTDTFKNGLIGYQTPSGGLQIKKDGLVRYRTATPLISVPSIIGLSESAALRKLNTARLRGRKIGVKQSPKRTGSVIETSPKKGSKVTSGTIVRYYLSGRVVRSLAAPKQLSPRNGFVYNIFPRTTSVTWQKVTGAANYSVEIDCFHCCSSRKWCTDVGKTYKIFKNIKTTRHSFNFVGAQPGRWRVWAVDASGKSGRKSEWRNFTHKK